MIRAEPFETYSVLLVPAARPRILPGKFKSCREYLSRLKVRRVVQKTTTGYALSARNIVALAVDLAKSP